MCVKAFSCFAWPFHALLAVLTLAVSIHIALFVILETMFAGAHDPFIEMSGFPKTNCSSQLWNGDAVLFPNKATLLLRSRFLHWLVNDAAERDGWLQLCDLFADSIGETGFNGLIEGTMGRLDGITRLQRFSISLFIINPLQAANMLRKYQSMETFLQALYLKHMAAIHILGKWSMNEMPQHGRSPLCIVAIGAWSKRYLLAQGGAPMHGSVWHAMLLATNHMSPPYIYWVSAQDLCNFRDSFAAISWSCFHGTGHAMMLSEMQLDARRLACFSPSSSIYSLHVSNLIRPMSRCTAAPSAQHAFLCADGLFDQFFQLASPPSEDDLWPGYCARSSLFIGPCFNNYLAGLKVYWPANKMRVGYLAFHMSIPDCSIAMFEESTNGGCIFGLSRNQFSFWWLRHQHFLLPREALVRWCQLVVDTVTLEQHVRHQRWLSCVASSMFGLTFGIGLSTDINSKTSEMCAGVAYFWQHIRNTTHSLAALCLSLGTTSVIPSSDKAVGILPPWFAQ